MLSVFVQVMVLTSFLTVETLCLDINIENNTYTDVQSSNIYCHSSRINSIKKITCDFRYTVSHICLSPTQQCEGKLCIKRTTIIWKSIQVKLLHLFSAQAAKLGSPSSILKENIEQLGGDLHLDIHNCSTLVISAVFYSWRLAFSSLHLEIENVNDVIQEEMPTHLGFGHNSLPSCDFISMD